MNDQKKSLEQIRKERNLEILRKMKAGESLSSFDTLSSWFPSRPKIEKDPNALKVLYGSPESKLSLLPKDSQSEAMRDENGCPVVQLRELRSKQETKKPSDSQS
jgi:hypothetical protein